MEKMKVAFDCDGTLLDFNSEPKKETVALFNVFKSLGCHMIVWSGGGKDYAQRVCWKLGLEADEIMHKDAKAGVDLCFDDMGVKLAKVNIKII